MSDKEALREVIRILAMLCRAKAWAGSAQKLEDIGEALKKADSVEEGRNKIV